MSLVQDPRQLMADICCADPVKVAAAIQAASPHREVLTPELLRYLRRDWSSVDTNSTDDESPLYLYYLAAEWRLTEAFPLLLSLLRQENADELLGDFLTEGAATVLATLWPGALDGLEALVLAPEDTMDAFARVAALEAISALVDFGKLSRAEGLACFRRLAEQLERRVAVDPEVDDLQITLSALVSQLMDLRAVELRDVMERLYATGLVDSSWTGSFADAAAELTTPRSRPLGVPIELAWDEVKGWYFFEPDADPLDPDLEPRVEGGQIDDLIEDLTDPDPRRVAAALQKASPHREAMASRLLESLGEDVELHCPVRRAPVPTFQYFLAAEWHLADAHDLLIQVLRGGDPEGYLADLFPSDATALLADTWPGTWVPLRDLARDPAAPSTYRGAALLAIACWVERGFVARGEVLDLYQEIAVQLASPLESGESKSASQLIMGTLLASAILHLPATELRETLIQLYELELVDEEVLASREMALAQLSRISRVEMRPPITSAWDEVRDWDFFAPMRRPEPFYPRSVPVPYQAPALPGRNDPCICGSGKKYKKCCG